MKQYIIITLIVTLLTTLCNAQQISFEKGYDFGHSETGNCVQQTPDSGYVITGRQNIGFSTAKMIIMKTDKYGILQWTNFMGDGTDQRYGNFVTNCITGGYAVTGFIAQPSFSEDIYVIRLNNNGDTIWTRHYGTPNVESGTCIKETLNHDFVISFANGDTTGILKIDSVGNVLWWKKFFLYTGATFNSIFELPTGGYIVAGAAGTGPPNLIQGIVMRTDSVGDSLWLKQFGGIAGDQFYEAHQTLDGNIVVAGISAPNVASTYNSYVLKLDLNGDTIWTKRFGSGDDECRSLGLCNDGGYVVTGTIYYNGTDNMFITKLNSSGDSLWTKEFGGPDSGGNFIKQTSDKGFIITGNTFVLDPNNGVYLVKTDSMGRTTVGINEPNKSIVFSAFPNPTKDVVYVKIEEYEDFTIIVMDEMGRMLYETKVSKNNVNSPNKIDFTAYDDGIYFVQITDENKNTTNKKIIKQ
jgi:Secretion system C-terminal sorting domain/Domain of unknown function (DUF5122) beta-propeller